MPHSSTVIPPDVRARIVLDDASLADELLRLTDWHTDDLYAWTARLGATRFINGLSRLVIDPERFIDDVHEPMARVGQGVVYVRTTDGRPLRVLTPPKREELVQRFYVPYHRALTELVGTILDRFGRCLVLDCHSFSSVPLPSEPDQTPGRPDVCIGRDPFHTPPGIVEALSASLRRRGYSVEVDRPFAGALVPLDWYGRDRRVAALMIETRRDLYCDEANSRRNEDFERVAADLEAATTEVLRVLGWC